jgi:hypothetical protein
MHGVDIGLIARTLAAFGSCGEGSHFGLRFHGGHLAFRIRPDAVGHTL